MLALEAPEDSRGVLAGDRAPDAPVRGRGGQLTRFFELLKGPHWTLLGYEVEHELVRARPGPHIHTFAPRGDLVDEGGFFPRCLLRVGLRVSL